MVVGQDGAQHEDPALAHAGDERSNGLVDDGGEFLGRDACEAVDDESEDARLVVEAVGLPAQRAQDLRAVAEDESVVALVEVHGHAGA